MRRPSLALLRLDVGEAGARRRIGNADQDLAGRALNLPASELWLALQRLVAVRTIKFEFVRVHSLHKHHAQTRCKKYMKVYPYFLSGEYACSLE
jgi:hypothetical protein